MGARTSQPLISLCGEAQSAPSTPNTPGTAMAAWLCRPKKGKNLESRGLLTPGPGGSNELTSPFLTVVNLNYRERLSKRQAIYLGIDH